MPSLVESTARFNELTSADPPLLPNTITVARDELTRIIEQLEEFKRPADFKPEGEKPKRMDGANEKATRYRERLAEYIKINTGIVIPVRSTINTRFYNLIAEYLGLFDK